jgi:hypothetical protein
MMTGNTAALTYSSVCRWLGGNHTRTETTWQTGNEAYQQRLTPYIIDADLPPAFTGCDYAAAPYEYLLHAISASLINTALRRAQNQDLTLTELSVESSRTPFVDPGDAMNLRAKVRPLNAETRRLVEDAVALAPVLRALKRTVALTFD